MPEHDTDLSDEQNYIDHAYECLDQMRAHAEELLEKAKTDSASEVDKDILRWHFQERVSSLADSKTPLIFGRIDEETQDTYRIGRRHVRDAKGEALVVDWRARVAAPFYRATIQDPMGVKRRRRYVVESRELIDLFDEYLDDPDSVLATSHGGVPDPLLAEIGRARTGQMRDIVATIQAEQDEIIRKPLKQLVIVQGGPGTGKTAVGLHRAAFLLYEHREILEKGKVLIIGPNRLFLSYISQVLPSLGETAAYQTTITGLAGIRYRARREDPAEVARIKGDARMAELLRTVYLDRLQPPVEDVRASFSGFLMRVPRELIARLMDTETAAKHSLKEARDRFINGVERYLLDTYEIDIGAVGPDPEEFVAAALRKSDLEKQLAKIWPKAGPEALVRKILTNKIASESGPLEPEEAKALRYRSARDLKEGGWSNSDIALLDEAEWLINGVSQRFGHTIVDEAQDLSAMEFRMVARRTRDLSLTVLGDLAQATTPASQTRWEEALEHLGATADAEIDELSMGYRVPQPVMDFANRLLPIAAPGVKPSRSVRPGAEPPRLLQSSDGFLLSDVEEEVRALSKLWQSIGVICPELLIDQLRKIFSESELAFSTWESEDLDEPIVLLPPAASKGLEFDAVVVIEPKLIMEEDTGARRLYVALTRAVQHLSVVHELPLPEALRD